MIPFRYLAFLLILCGTFQSCSQPKALVYQDVQNFRVRQADAGSATVVLDLVFYNPNGYGLDLKGGNIQVYFSNRLLGTAMVDERTKVPAKATFMLPISIKAGIQEIFVNALDILSSQEITVRLEGTIKAGKGRIFVNIPVKYEGQQRLAM